MVFRNILMLSTAVAAAAAKPPHIIVALVDDLGRNNVPWYNPQQTKDSGLKELVETEGAIFDRFYTFKFCSPTRSSFLSGRFPIHVNQQNAPGVGKVGGIDLRMKLLPQKMKQAGYTTAIVGKWHCGARSNANLPINRGFDEHLGFLGGGEDHNTQRSYETNNYVDLWNNNGPAYGKNGTYSCFLYGRQAVDIVMKHDVDTPLFLYLPFHDTHAPYEDRPEYEDPTVDYEPRKIMQAMLSCVADATMNLTKALKEKEMWNNTLFFWASDNGGPQYWSANNYPFRGGKGTDFEGGVRVAAFATGGMLAPELRGTTIHSPMHLADLHTSVCMMTGQTFAECGDEVEGLPSTDGFDLRDYFTTKNATRPDGDIVLSSNSYIDGEWKYVATSKNTSYCNGQRCGYWTGPVWPINNNHTPEEEDPGCPVDGCLFNIADDPTEHHELSKQYPERQQAMKAKLAQYVAGAFQTNSSGGYDKCESLDKVAAANGGFAAPLCTKGTSD
eukprot:TRINITY_DN16161_c0_g1_i1.p1 TRINITY_DN16161_c0_g1~~TRINITY_DN16161_c0_g1_i1.p1  ORF type:complete len:510 (+),score=108.53 TRINITY_DN16161_c0_g1_i1:36-1532(+)